jgi:putative ABC transport system permease protein
MIDLEKNIREWKKDFQRQDSLEDGTLAEMELLLRDAYKAHRRDGLEEEDAFRAAAAQVGNAESVGSAYRRNRIAALNRRSPFRPTRFMPALVGNGIKVALRMIRREKGYSFIKVFGLALGIACGLIIFLFIRQELNFDRFHVKADRLFRLEEMIKIPRGVVPYSFIWTKIGPVLPEKFPDVESAVRVSGPSPHVIDFKNHRFKEEFAFADPDFFEIFTFPLLCGDPKSALREPYAVVISEALAAKLMPGENPLGQVIQYEGKADFLITGVMKDIPAASHLQTDLVGSLASLEAMGNPTYLSTTYLLLRDGAAAGRVEKLFAAFDKTGLVPKTCLDDRFYLRPLTSVYLNSSGVAGVGSKSEIKYSYYLAVLGLFILLLAVVNAANLSTANALKRVREIGVKKALGAGRGHVIRQFLIESMVVSFLAAIVALVLSSLILPVFNSIARRNLAIDDFANFGFLLGLLAFLLVAGLASGIYPAWLLASLRTADTIRGKLDPKFGSALVRRLLVVFQFSVCILFLIAAGVAFRQLRYVSQKDLGFDKEGLMILPSLSGEGTEAFKNELLQNPDIIAVSLAGGVPGEDSAPVYEIVPEGQAKDNPSKIHRFDVDAEYFKTYGVPFLAGRDFLPGKADLRHSAVINERAAKAFGWASPLGKRLTLGLDSSQDIQDVTVVGVVQDFHLLSLHTEITPVVFLLTDTPDSVAVRARTNQLSSTVAAIAKTWQKFNPAGFWNVQFLNDRLALQYEADSRTQRILIFASVLAVLIACLGLLGLAAFAAQSRTKEIGIRKALGASTPSMVILLGREFLLCVLAANVIAWPAAYALMKGWLRNFAYRIPIGLGVFLSSTMAALLMAVLVVGYQSIKTARANPADSLRSE